MWTERDLAACMKISQYSGLTLTDYHASMRIVPCGGGGEYVQSHILRGRGEKRQDEDRETRSR